MFETISVKLSYDLTLCSPSPKLIKKTEELITNDDGSMKWKNECYKTREDYFECLHAKKEWAMVKRVNEEEARQKALATSG